LQVGGVALYNNNKHAEITKRQDELYSKISVEKDYVDKEFSAALVRLDSLLTENSVLQSKLVSKNSQVNSLRREIRKLITKQNLTEAEKKKAEELIKQLEEKINSLLAQNEEIAKANSELRGKVDTLQKQGDDLVKQVQSVKDTNEVLKSMVDVGSTLFARSINVTALKVKNNGEVKRVKSAKRTDELEISFDVENRLMNNDTAEVYVVVKDATGSIVLSTDGGSGKISLRDREEMEYSKSVKIVVNGYQSVKTFIKQPKFFEKVIYAIDIYNNGFKIVSTKKELVSFISIQKIYTTRHA